MPRGAGVLQKKILLLLVGGVALGLSGSPRQYFYLLHNLAKEWRDIDRRALKRAVAALYVSKLVRGESNHDRTYTLVLTEHGKEKALAYNIETMAIKQPSQWDKKWRMVIFDIPERLRKSRDLLRIQLVSLGFYELQKSVFVHPYECKDEIEYIIEFHRIRKYVRFMIVDSIDTELHLKQHFGL